MMLIKEAMKVDDEKTNKILRRVRVLGEFNMLIRLFDNM